MSTSNDERAAGDLLAATPCVHCPVCGDEYTHLQSIVFSASTGKPVEVTFARREDNPDVRVHINPAPQLAPVPPSSRRGATMLVFDGECGHRFGMTFRQHKGNEFMHIYPLDDG